MTQGNFWESFTKSAADLGKNITDAASQASAAIGETALKAGESVSSAAVEAGKAVAGTVVNAGNAAKKAIEKLLCFSEDDSLAFYGALFAVAAADGSIDPEELNLILNSPDISNMSNSAKQQIQNYCVSPPSLEDSLKKLAKADNKLKFGLMFYIFNIIWVDKKLTPGEEKAIEIAQTELGISKEQVNAINTFTQKMGEIRERGLNDEYAVNTMKDAVTALKKVGVPIDSFSSSETATDLNLSMTYSDELFWEKLSLFATKAGKEVVEKALTLYYAAEHPKTPTKHKLLIYGALAYLILPADAIPDILPAVGLGDDLSALVVAAGTIASNINEEVKETAKQRMKEWFGDSLES